MNIRKANQNDYPRMMEIWESAVKATHDFLKEEDFELFKKVIPSEFLPQVRAFVIEDNNNIQAFFGVSDDNLEMLFVDAAMRGKGFGKIAVDYIIQTLQIYKVDVNEQNQQAVAFYLKSGYEQIGRSEKDGMGKDYPLLHFVYNPQQNSKQTLKIIGILVRTTNQNNQAAEDIGALWQRFYTEKISEKISNKVNDNIYSIYTDYDNNYLGHYTTILGVAVHSLDNMPEGLTGRAFPEVRFDTWTAKGTMPDAVVKTWTEIWSRDAELNRAYNYDYELYDITKCQLGENSEVSIFLSTK